MFPKFALVPVGVLALTIGTASRGFGPEAPEYSSGQEIGDMCTVIGMLIKREAEQFDKVLSIKTESGRVITVIVGLEIKDPGFELIPPLKLKLQGAVIDTDTVSAVGTISQLPFRMTVYINELTISNGAAIEPHGGQVLRPGSFVPKNGIYRCLVERNEKANLYYTPISKKNENGLYVEVDPTQDDSGIRP